MTYNPARDQATSSLIDVDRPRTPIAATLYDGVGLYATMHGSDPKCVSTLRSRLPIIEKMEGRAGTLDSMFVEAVFTALASVGAVKPNGKTPLEAIRAAVDAPTQVYGWCFDHAMTYLRDARVEAGLARRHLEVGDLGIAGVKLAELRAAEIRGDLEKDGEGGITDERLAYFTDEGFKADVDKAVAKACRSQSPPKGMPIATLAERVH
jgi:hypothetical protein